MGPQRWEAHGEAAQLAQRLLVAVTAQLQPTCFVTRPTWRTGRGDGELSPSSQRSFVAWCLPQAGGSPIPISGPMRGVQLHGWDGIVKADEATEFVPEGASGWEMGTGAAPKRKAETDLENRTTNPKPLVAEQSSFVFVTPRRWNDQQKWAREQSDAGPWREVRVIDADDLAHWLEQAPGVHTWLSVQIGKAPPHAIDLRSYWKGWSGATQPRLTCRFLLAGRDTEATRLRERLADSSGQAISVQAESRREAIAAIYCAISELPSDQAESVLARAVVVDQPSELRHLIASPPPLVLIPDFDAEDLVSAAVRAGHTVVVPLGAADPEADDVVHFRPVFPPHSSRGLARARVRTQSSL